LRFKKARASPKIYGTGLVLKFLAPLRPLDGLNKHLNMADRFVQKLADQWRTK